MDMTPAKVLLELKNKYCKTSKTQEDLKNWVTSVLNPESSFTDRQRSFWYHGAHLKFLEQTKTFSIVYNDTEKATYCEICLPFQNYLEYLFGIGDFDKLLEVTQLGPPDWDLITSQITEHIHLCTNPKNEGYIPKLSSESAAEILRKH